MMDSPNDKSDTVQASTPSPAASVESLVGPVNATFEPLASGLNAADAMETTHESEGDVDKTPTAAAPATSSPRSVGPPPLQTPPASSEQRLPGCLHDVLLVLFSILLGAAFALILLWGVNGTLFLNDREKTSALEVALHVVRSQQETTQRQQEEQRAAIAAIQTRLQGTNDRVQELGATIEAIAEDQEKQHENVVALQTRSVEIEQAIETLRQEMVAMQDRQDIVEGEFDALSDQLNAVAEDVTSVKETAARFDRFVKGLIALVSEVAPEELRSTTVKMTPTPTPNVDQSSLQPAPQINSSSLEQFPPLRPLPTPAGDSGVVFGLVWLDANENGFPDADESVAPGVRILLKDESEHVLLNMITGVDGRFAFINVPPGNYWVEAVPPDASTLTTSTIYPLTVHSGGSIEVNFGLLQP